MTYWTNGCETFETEDEARNDAYENMTWDDLESYFRDYISFHDFFTRVCENMSDTFFEEFEDVFCDAENNYFMENYWIKDKPEE